MKTELENVNPTTTQRPVNIPSLEKDLIHLTAESMKKDIAEDKPMQLLHEKLDFIKRN